MENFEFFQNSKLRLIRNAKEKDINALANLCAQLGYPAAHSDIAARLEKLRHNPKNHIFVAEIPFQTGENNTVAGFISFESYETIYCDAGINITGFVVDEKARKTGIGRSLMKAVEFYAKENGFSFIRAESSSTRNDAHEAYRKLGFDSEKSQTRFLKNINQTL